MRDEIQQVLDEKVRLIQEVISSLDTDTNEQDSSESANIRSAQTGLQIALNIIQSDSIDLE